MFIKVHEYGTNRVAYVNGDSISSFKEVKLSPNGHICKTKLYTFEEFFMEVEESAEDIFKMLSAE